VKWRVESGAQRILPSDLPINTLQSKPGQAQAAQRHRAKRSAFELPSEPSKLDALKYFNDLTSPLHLLPPSRFVSLCCVSSPNSLPRYQFASLQVLTYHSSPLHVLLSLKVDHTSISPPRSLLPQSHTPQTNRNQAPKQDPRSPWRSSTSSRSSSSSPSSPPTPSNSTSLARPPRKLLNSEHEKLLSAAAPSTSVVSSSAPTLSLQS